METDSRAMGDEKEHHADAYQGCAIRPWTSETPDVQFVSRAPIRSESRSTTPTLNAEPDASSDTSDEISDVDPGIGRTQNPQEEVLEIGSDEIALNPSLDNRAMLQSSSDFAGVGSGVAASETRDGDEHAHSVGLAHMSVVTGSSTSDDSSDDFRLIDVCVCLDRDTWIGFGCKRDTASHVNAITQGILKRLNRSEKDLARSNLKGELRGVCKESVPVLGRIKITFYVVGLPRPYREWFYVFPDAYLPCFDAILSEKFVKRYKLLVEGLSV